MTFSRIYSETSSSETEGAANKAPAVMSVEIEPEVLENYDQSSVMIGKLRPRLNPNDPEKVKWFPFLTKGLKVPTVLAGLPASEAQFDPLNLTRNSTKRALWMREAEVRHARLAMLGAALWPLSELHHSMLAKWMGLESLFSRSYGAPSIVAGGLAIEYANVWIYVGLCVAMVPEYLTLNKSPLLDWEMDVEDKKDYTPGDQNFDPFSLMCARGESSYMQAAELKNGRLAMVAVAYYFSFELITGHAIVEVPPYHI